jgi:7,8-dihydropterin-6-yl-methyl-4-(beta-D-ribofuranosyl)aminobenzene 5'-phosphate synthase
MRKKMRFYVLVEDTTNDAEFKAEHGLSIYFEEDEKKFLLDTGQTALFTENAKRLGVDLGQIDYVILSHGHYDHTGGLPYLPIDSKVKILTHPYNIYPKYDETRTIGFPEVKSDWNISFSEIPRQLTPHVCYLGQIPGEGRESLGRYVKDNVSQTDYLLDDSAVAIHDGERLIVVCGCAHLEVFNGERLCSGKIVEI